MMNDISKMLNSGKLILRGKRWRKFNEFTIVPIFVLLAATTGCILRIRNIGHFEREMIPFLVIPLLFIVWWIPYKNKELKFSVIGTENSVNENYSFVIKALKNLKWTIVKNDKPYVEARISSAVGVTWGSDMIFILVDDKRILVTSLCNLEIPKQQAFFTFGQLNRNKQKFISAILDLWNCAQLGLALWRLNDHGIPPNRQALAVKWNFTDNIYFKDENISINAFCCAIIQLCAEF